MSLDPIQVVVRPRNHWESIDLGLSMVQIWRNPLYKLWLTSFLPIALISTLFAYQIDQRDFTFFLMWWLKPLYDRIILYFLSRALFGEIVNVRKFWKFLPKLLFKTHLFKGLTIERFSLARSFRLPVWQLEDLPRGTHPSRFSLLAQRTLNPAKNFIMVCLFFEGGLYLAFIGFLYLMMPVTTQVEWWRFLAYDSSTPLWIAISQIFCYGLALSLVEPLYVAGGFVLYLNRRVHLEGWDIEITFRGMMRQYESQHHHAH